MKIDLKAIIKENGKFIKKTVFKPYGKMLCMRLILFYQKRLSKHTCMFRPTCSQYTLECINNHGALLGVVMGMFRILRCHPWTKGGYDPAPERFFQKKWLA